MYLICHVTSKDHLMEGSCNHPACNHPDKFGDHRHCDSRDIVFAI